MIGFFKNKFMDEDLLVVPIKSKVVQYGLGTFEGVRAYWNDEQKQLYIFRAPEHFKRLFDSCKIFRLNHQFTAPELTQVAIDLLKQNNMKCNTYVRPVFFHGSTKMAPVFEETDTEFAMYCQALNDYLDKSNGIDVCVSSWMRVPDNAIPARAKPTGLYINSALARDEANHNGFAEGIFLTRNGFVSEGCGEHLFIIRDGVLFSPPSTEDNLDGITRKTIIELATNDLGIEFKEKQINRTELYVADELFFVGTGAEVTPIRSVDRRQVGSGKVGELTKKIQTLYLDVCAGKVPKYQHWLTKVY